MKKLVVLIPAYNEETSIAKVISSIPKTIEKLVVTVLIVNDGSTDKTAAVAKNVGAVVVSHSHNQGVGKAFQTGLDKALELGADIMVNIDADGQFSVSDIPKLIKPILDDKADFVTGNRFLRADGLISKPKNMPTEKYYGNLLMAKLISFLSNQKFTDVSSGFRAYSKKALLMLNLTGKFTYTQESFIDLAYKGLEIKQIPVKVKYFKDRKSKVANNLIKYGYRTLKIIIRTFRDYRPLLFFCYLSLLPLAFGLSALIFLVVHYLNTQSFTPYKFVGFASIYLFSLVLILWLAGFIADMFVRIRLNQERMLYLIKKEKYAKSH